MTVCKFFRQGSCRFGDKCRFEHPSGLGANQSNQSENRPPNQHQSSGQNRFGPLQNSSNAYPSGGNQYQSGRNQYSSGGNRYPPNENGYSSGNNQYSSGGQRNQTGRGQPAKDSRDPRNSRGPRDTKSSFGITRESIEDDMRIERPQWIMSCYGPGRDAPVQLFGGYPLEQSFEELRVQHYLTIASGNPPQQSGQMELEMAAQSNQQVQNVLNDLEGAIDYIVNGANSHPNRLDLVAEASRNAQSTGVFARSNARPPNPGPSGFQNNRPQSGFGAPGFGPPQNAAPAFGQPNHSNQIGPFGVTPGFGTPNPSSGFGNTSQQQNLGSFGLQPQHQAPAGFGSNPTGFGQPQSLGPVNDNTLGNPPFAQQNGAFGVPQTQQYPNSGFGQPPTFQQTNSVPFGGAPQTNGTAFVQPSLQNMNGGFGAAPTQQPPPSSFIQPSSNMNNAFGTALAPMPVVNGFQPHNQNPSSNGFVNEPQNQSPMTNGFQPNGHTAPPNADVTTYTTRDANNKLLTWKGQPVSYIDSTPCFQNHDGSWERIWFPDGPPAPSQTQGQEIGFSPAVQEAYQYLSQNGVFQGGIMPEMAPSTEMCRWDI